MLLGFRLYRKDDFRSKSCRLAAVEWRLVLVVVGHGEAVLVRVETSLGSRRYGRLDYRVKIGLEMMDFGAECRVGEDIYDTNKSKSTHKIG